MKCIKCSTVNVHNANYCKNCAYEFSEKEQIAAEKWTFIGLLKRIERLKEKITFCWLFDHLAFKVGSVLGILLLGFIFIFSNDNSFMIKENENYTVKFNEKNNEYYLYSKLNMTNLDLYIPANVTDLVVKHYDGENKLIISEDFGVSDDIKLYSNSDDYYVLEARYNKNKSDKLKLFIFQEKDGELND